MISVNVTELRQNLPRYLARASAGDRVRVTSRGRVIAEITGPAASRDEAEGARRRLAGSVLRFDKPLEPVFDPGDWELGR